jgi:uncharacterized membrane protein
MFPPLPSDWSALHPLVIHFPIALLLVAPLLVGVAMVARTARRPYLISALVLMALGTVMTSVAVSTGEAASELAEGAGAVEAMVERHEELAETTQTIFTVLTLLFAGLLVVPTLFKRKLEGSLFFALHAVFLVLYLAGTVVLANTAHQGGLLVHQQGVHARPAAGTTTTTTIETSGGGRPARACAAQRSESEVSSSCTYRRHAAMDAYSLGAVSTGS